MSSTATRRRCVYCGWPAARARIRAGRVVELAACRSHLDLLPHDPAFCPDDYLDELASSMDALDMPPSARSRERTATPPAVPLAALSTSSTATLDAGSAGVQAIPP